MKVAAFPFQLDVREMAEFCCERGIRRLAVFGSALRYDFGPESDIDLLVEYIPGRHPGLMLFRQQDELTRLLGRTVDLHTPASLGQTFRKTVLNSAVPIFEHA